MPITGGYAYVPPQMHPILAIASETLVTELARLDPSLDAPCCVDPVPTASWRLLVLPSIVSVLPLYPNVASSQSPGKPCRGG